MSFVVLLIFATVLEVVQNGPCGGASMDLVMQSAMAIYNNRDQEHYTQGSDRWYGIANRVCPPAAPKYSDCSSAVTWAYWTAYGDGPDFLNDAGWKAGYTGTLVSHGRNVTNLPGDLQPGDLCFYYHPMHHVAIYVGNGQVVSHGHDPAGLLAWNYADVDECHRYV